MGRSHAAPIWPPVTSWISMLIMEPVNANDMRLRIDVRQERKPPPLPAVSSPSASLTLNYNYWALGTGSSLLHLSDVGRWRALSLLLTHYTFHSCVFTDHLRSLPQCFGHFLVSFPPRKVYARHF